MAAENTLTVKYFGQQGLYGIVNLNGNFIPDELNQMWTHKEKAETALREHCEKARAQALEGNKNGTGKRKQAVQSVRSGTDN